MTCDHAGTVARAIAARMVFRPSAARTLPRCDPELRKAWKRHLNRVAALKELQQLAGLLRVSGAPAGELSIHPPCTSLPAVHTALESNHVPVAVINVAVIDKLHTGDTLVREWRWKGLGTEPMTCPPNAFASGDGMTTVEPGQSVTTAWGGHLT